MMEFILDESDYSSDDDSFFPSYLNTLMQVRRRMSWGNRDVNDDSGDVSVAVYVIPNASDSEDDSQKNMKANRKSYSLLDLASQVVAKNCTCNQLEGCEPPLDEALLKKVAHWAFPQDEKQVRAFASLTDKYNDWDRAISLLRDSRVKEMWQVGFMATAHLAKGSRSHSFGSTSQGKGADAEIQVSVTFEKQRIVLSTCSECQSDVWCPHVIAAVIFRIRNPEKVSMHAPMTEALSTLDRDQLQKLLQYAVQEDPAGILGKVFKHIDKLRDSSSEMNVIQGAPDPTFGGAQGMKNQWQLSLECMEKNLLCDLKEMSGQHSFDVYYSGSTYYHDSYDEIEKADTRMFRYLRKSLDLVRQGETWSAASVLIRISKCVIQQMRNTPTSDSPGLPRLAHDLAHIFTLFVLNPRKIARASLLKAARELQRRGADVYSNFQIQPSLWAEMPSISTLHESKLEEGCHKGFFTEALCAGLVEPWSPELNDLINGKKSPQESKYEDSIIVMMSRLECLYLLTSGKPMYMRVGRLATRVLYKVAAEAQRYSILGTYFNLVSEDSEEAAVLRTILRLHPDNCHKSAASSRQPGHSGKGGVRKRKMGGKSVPDKRQKKSKVSDVHSVELELPKSQLVYCLLYLCDVLIKVQKACGSKCPISPKHLTGFCLFALEMSRFRTVACEPAVTTLEHNWIWRLESSIMVYLKANVNSSAGAVGLYLDALGKVGCSFYDARYPLILLDLVLFLWQKCEELTVSRKEDIINICAEILLDSSDPLAKFTLPSSSPLDLILETLNSELSERSSRRHRDFALKKYHSIAETFLSQVQPENKNHFAQLMKVLQHFERYTSFSLLKSITKDLRLHMTKFDRHPNLLEGVMRILIQTIKMSDTARNYLTPISNLREDDISFILGLSKQLGLSSLKFFVGCWQKFLQARHVLKLLRVLENQLKACRVLPKEAIQLIMQYFDAEQDHDEAACDLLGFFKPGDANFKQATQKILLNSKFFPANALFQLAKLTVYHEKQEGTDEENMSDNAFQAVEAALRVLKDSSPTCINAATYTNLDWLCHLCTKGPQTKMSKTSYFAKMVKELCTNALSHPGVLLKVLKNLEKTPPLLRQASALGDALLQAYGTYFDDRFQECGHAAYATVINEMHRARLQCKQYAKNGEARFEKDIISVVRAKHAGKKKLLRMLDQEFGEKSNIPK